MYGYFVAPISPFIILFFHTCNGMFQLIKYGPTDQLYESRRRRWSTLQRQLTI